MSTVSTIGENQKYLTGKFHPDTFIQWGFDQ